MFQVIKKLTIPFSIVNAITNFLLHFLRFRSFGSTEMLSLLQSRILLEDISVPLQLQVDSSNAQIAAANVKSIALSTCHVVTKGARAWARCALFGKKVAPMDIPDEEDGFKVTLESLYAKRIKEISYDEEETYQE